MFLHKHVAVSMQESLSFLVLPAFFFFSLKKKKELLVPKTKEEVIA